ncbi:MAG TPA: hypothetical protein VLL48_08925, partial [Longimicrobiales bacterium]|nr:hypothetical protein [Longimicrobiales bacterium]
MRRLRRAAAWTLAVGGGGLLLAGAILFALVGTAPGARWVLARLAPETVEIATVKGSFLGSLRLGDVSVRSSTVAVRLDSVRLDLAVARLLAREVEVRRLVIAGAELRTTGAEAADRPGGGP